MFKNYIIIAMLLCFAFGSARRLYAQESGEQITAPAAEGFVIGETIEVKSQEPDEEDIVVEEEIEEQLKIVVEEPVEEEEIFNQFITADVLTPKNAEPAIKYYIHSDINRKFTGLITNLKLEKIYGVIQEYKTATVYFDYSYTSVRNRDYIIMDKGKMTFIKFNSGKWFNEELSIYLMDKYQPYRRSVTGGLMQLKEQ